MPGTLAEQPAATFVPGFRLTEPDRPNWRRLAAIAGASIALHVLLIGVSDTVFEGRPYGGVRQLRVEVRPREATKLIAPLPSQLTQRAPNKSQVTPEFNISALPPRAAQPNVPASPGAAAVPRQKFSMPDRRPPGISAPNMVTDAPPVDTAALRSNVPAPALGTQVQAPPPQIQTAEKPKIAFERPGATSGTPTGVGRIPVPRPGGTVEEAARQAARSGGRGLIVGDEDAIAGASPQSPSVPIPGKLGSAVELLSDPMGADFWPYLVKVLAAVRRNWFAVIPESARFGRAGRTTIQFAINKDGSVPKLVISAPSGAEALDRAAVAGISASNPFPPLPADYKGNQVRLQFVFKYNVR
jgi:TonB family protein